MSLFLEINGQKHTPLEAVRLAQKLYQTGNKQDAFSIFCGVLKLVPNHAEAQVGAGFCHLDQGNWTEALMCATQARQADKSYLRTYHLAIMAMQDRVPLQKSKVWTDNGLAEHPNDPTLLLQRGTICSDADDQAGVKKCVERILATDSNFSTPAMAVSLLGTIFPAREWATLLQAMPVASTVPLMKLAVESRVLISLWLQNDHDGMARVLKDFIPAWTQMKADNNLRYRSETERKVLHTTVQNVNGYGVMFEKLMANPPQPPTGLPTLYMVGDSHVMPPHGQVVSFKGHDHVVQSDVSVGVKLWHLACPDNYMRLRKTVRDIVQALPEGAPVAFSIGEIDARSDQGLWPLLAAGDKPLDALLRDTCDPAFAWLKELAGNRPVIICGVPAPVRSRDDKALAPTNQHDDYARMVGALNAYMGTLARANGWTFADLHALTVGPDGLFSSEVWHLEDTHLKAGALAAALAL